MKKYFFFFFAIVSQIVFAQNSKTASTLPDIGIPVPHKSIHQEQSEEYSSYNFISDSQWDSLRIIQNNQTKKTLIRSKRSCNLNKRVYGWHPYWSNGAQTNYDWNGLTDLCYFSYDVNPSTGNASSTHGWSTAAVVPAALAAGVNVTLCATLFSSHSTFFGSSTSQQTLITNLITMIRSKSAHGVNIDFEGMASADKAGFTDFMINLCNQMHDSIPGSEVSIALYSVDWGGVFDMPALNPYVDLFIIMGYDYYYSGSSSAGPEDPLYNFQTGYNYTLAKSVSYYLNKGASKSKLLLGLPYYGREWATNAATIPSSVSGGGTKTVIYNAMRNDTNGYYTNRQWDVNSFSSWFPSVRSGANWQAFVDDAPSMAERFDIVNQIGIGGIGIWALGYDDGYDDFWNLIRNKFTDCATVPCKDTIYDLGGPNRDYNNNENFTYTIAPTGATGLTLDFTSFSTELNYDRLWIYDGTSTSSALIGAYHGTTSPGTITSSGGALTIRFKSDNLTVKPGWQAIWNCTIDNIAPSTIISAPSSWVTGNFTTNFTDTDNAGGTGIAKSYYQVMENNGTEWRANNNKGFFNDNFDAAIHPDWTSMAGTWSITGGYLNQSDQTNSNTNIYAPLTQNLSNQYLYNWQGKINGTGSNRRAGFHFFCDDGTQTNRGNSYFVWIRCDQSSLEIYKVTNNVFSLMNTSSLTTAINTWHDYKIIYDRTIGKMDVYVDNTHIANWTDPNPLTNGNAISFRSGNCDYTVNDFKVYRSRSTSLNVSVGSASTNDVRYQNQDPSSPSCRIKSVTKDVAGNLSSVGSKDVNIDWTIPSDALINDGNANDIDTTFSQTQLSANWSVCTDNNSAILRYWYAIGTTAGGTDVINWTANGTNTSATESGLSLFANQLYYFSVRSEDGAGLFSNISASDGQIVMLATSVNGQNNSVNIKVFPNPFQEISTLEYTLQNDSDVEILLTDILGKRVYIQEKQHMVNGEHSVMIYKNDLNLSKGVYTLSIKIDEKANNYKLIIN
jgi:spore germination protein YaaH